MSRNKELLSKIGLRLDGRRANELRRIRCKLGVFTEPDGSAYIEQGLTKVLAAVYGPHQVFYQFKEQHYLIYSFVGAGQSYKGSTRLCNCKLSI